MSRQGNIARKLATDPGGMVKARTPSASELKGQDPSRKSLEHQLAGLKRNLNDLYKRLGYAHKAGKREKVYVLCDLITKQRGRFLSLATKLNDLPRVSEPERPAPKAGMGRSKAPGKGVKRYPRWSDD